MYMRIYSLVKKSPYFFYIFAYGKKFKNSIMKVIHVAYNSALFNTIQCFISKDLNM